MNNIPSSTSSQSKSPTNQTPSFGRRNVANESLPYDDGRLHAVEGAVTAALSTPHDAILSGLRGSQHTPDHASPLHSEMNSLPQPAPRMSSLPSAGSVERDGSQSGEGILNGRRSTAGHIHGVSLERDALYDPFTGALAGVILPHPSAQPLDGKKSDAEFNQAKDDLWCHLGRIRELQSQIAGMHVQMEGLGLNDGTRGGPKRHGAASTRIGPDSIGVDDWVDGGEDEHITKAEKDTEFSHLSESFGGRKVAIDDVMDKLDELSRALTTFHALPTPVVDFSGPASGHSTRGTQSTTPILQSPSPPFSHPNSPTLSPPLSPIQTKTKIPSQLKMASLGKSPLVMKPLSESPIQEQSPHRKGV
ncbi:hypothetical protein QCA50_002143 [Cerrena zonata]|uniref:Uncharacterized protein n=1 Tax=Cerrena zonata TaxID=2478898 RepID=A0AAW0GUQ9_9APHY